MAKKENDNGILTPEQIAALFDTQSDAPTASEEQTAVVEEVSNVEPEPVVAKPEPASGGVLTPEQIAALFDTQTDAPTASEEQTDVVVEEATTVEPAPTVVETKTKSEPEPYSGGVMTPEQIAALFDIPSDNPEQTSAVEASETVKPEPYSGGVMTPEQIATLFDIPSDAPAASEEQNTVAEESVVVEPEAPSGGMLSQDQIAALFDDDDDNATPTSEENTVTFEASSVAEPEPDVTEHEVKLEPDATLIKSNLLEKFKTNIFKHFKKIISIKKKSTSLTETSVQASVPQTVIDELPESTHEDAPITTTENLVESANQSDEISLEKTESDEAVTELEQNDEPIANKKDKSEKRKKAPKVKVPKEEKTNKQSSTSKVAITVLGVIVLMSSSFAAGYFSRDFVNYLNPDPVKEAAKAEAKAKLAEAQAKEVANAKRAEELAAINPKDYTSSMYLESIILKGQADKMTSIKLKKIDDVSLLSQFTKLRRVRLYDMTGKEDLSVIQTLKGVEEILIENSVIKNQFTKGSFDSVKTIEMTDCTVENADQFGNFKNVIEMYADTTKFISKDGNLNVASQMSALESLTLSNCGAYGELVGVQNLKQLKKLKLSRTIVKNTSYVQNPQIESVTVDISFAKSTEPLVALSKLKNLSTLNLQIGKSPLTSSEMRTALDLIISEHPDVSIQISSD